MNYQSTIAGRHRGSTDYICGHWSWAIPLLKAINLSKAGPLLCGGITVFNPIVLSGVKPTDSVGIIGLSYLGHIAIKFLKHCRYVAIAFSSTQSKKEEIITMGATKNSEFRSSKEIESLWEA